MSDADPRDEGTWLDDMPNPYGEGALTEAGAIGNAARRWARAADEQRAAGARAAEVARALFGPDERARAAVRRIGVER